MIEHVTWHKLGKNLLLFNSIAAAATLSVYHYKLLLLRQHFYCTKLLHQHIDYRCTKHKSAAASTAELICSNYELQQLDSSNIG
jgi:hypothetical protein